MGRIHHHYLTVALLQEMGNEKKIDEWISATQLTLLLRVQGNRIGGWKWAEFITNILTMALFQEMGNEKSRGEGTYLGCMPLVTILTSSVNILFFCFSHRHSISLGIFSFFVVQNIESRSALSSSSTTRAFLWYLFSNISPSPLHVFFSLVPEQLGPPVHLHKNHLLHLWGMTCLLAINFWCHLLRL